jgi:mannose-6-phosphate isomerase-like protein (cupin superfamily)
MPVLGEAELKELKEPTVMQVVGGYVRRYWDMMALAAAGPVPVIGEKAIIRDQPGFEVDFISRGSISEDTYATPRHEILMVHRGHWKLAWGEGQTALAPGDTVAVPPGLAHSLVPSMSGEAALYRVRSTDDPAGPTIGW